MKMKMKNKILAIFLAAAACLCAGAQTPGVTIATVSITEELPACADTSRAALRFPGSREAQDLFYSRLDSVIAGTRKNINIWHIGGSHVQAGHFPYRIMENFCSIAPGMKGDRGFIFPYRLAKTNFDKSFTTTTTGEWECPFLTRPSKLEKPRYGVTGFGARTADSTASVAFGLGISADTCRSFSSLRVLGYGSSERAVPYVVSGKDTLRHRTDSLTQSFVFDLPEETDSVLVGFSIPEGENFVLNGLQPVSGRSGINYFASGVNGAKVTSWIDQCEDLERDLQLVMPDLVIFGLGINDSACPKGDFKPERFKDNYRRLIALIRRTRPDCAFIFITNNDSYRYVRRGMTWNENGAAVRRAMTELAEENGAAVWDLYGIMGGAHTVLTWRDCGLVKKDKLHFTKEGYMLLGDLFFNAIATDHNDSR